MNTDGWPHVAAALLFDRHARLIVYLRDDKPTIPFPDCWDFFGGHVEPGESIDQALVREVREELGIELRSYTHFRDYVCATGDAWPNVKHIYWAKLDVDASDLTLHEGQRLATFTLEQSRRLRWANVLGSIVADFIEAGVDIDGAPACAIG